MASLNSFGPSSPPQPQLVKNRLTLTYVYVDGIYLKRSWGGAYENVAVMIAIGADDDGYREVIGAAEGFTESAECWRELLS